ncbi:MAG TPA: hypothetical protein VJ921_10500 [Vicinamibacteria bacterium]|nr:hypothetical protein [Vicinamibacteria bacterium]
MHRRRFLSGVLSLPTLSILPDPSEKAPKTRLVLLGTGGGPRPRKQSSGSSQVVIANGVPYVIDCGEGVARHLVFADVPHFQGPVIVGRHLMEI